MKNTATPAQTIAAKQHHGNENRTMQIIEIVFYVLGFGYWVGMFTSM